MIKILLAIFIGLAVSAAQAKEPDKEGTIYSPVGKRDPFRAPSESMVRSVASLTPIEQFSIEQLTLRAILKGLGRNRAMFEDPQGKTYIIGEGDIIGRERGTISKILNMEVIITEKTFNYLGEENLFEKVVSLPNEEDFALDDKQPSRTPDEAPKGAAPAPAPAPSVGEPKAARPQDKANVRGAVGQVPNSKPMAPTYQMLTPVPTRDGVAPLGSPPVITSTEGKK